MNTKFRILAVAIVVPFLFFAQSCEKIKDEINEASAFDATIDLPAETFNLDSTQFKSSDGVLDDWRLILKYQVPIDADIEQILNDNGLSSASLSDGTFKDIKLSIISPPTPDWVTFSFANKFKVGLAYKADLADELIIATTDPIPPGAKTVNFNLAGEDITPYVDNGNFWISVYADRLTPLPVHLVTLELVSSIEVKVKPL